VGEGTADLILGLEPLESLRYAHYLKPHGLLVTALDPVPNIADYPTREELAAMLGQAPHVVAVEAGRLARDAGTPLAANSVMVGAASHALPLSVDTLEICLREGFARKGEKVVSMNLAAFRAGREAVTTVPG
jgi:indolepyruvate ferredoxin oxidoreductase beta subunit